MRRFLIIAAISGLAFSILYLVGCSARPDISEYFDGTNNVQLIGAPASVTAWRTAAWFKGDQNYSPGDTWQKAGEAVPVPSNLVAQLSKVLLDRRSYGSAKASIALPCVVINFSNSNRGVGVFFSFADNSLAVKTQRFEPSGRTLIVGGDFDPARAELVRIIKKIFPNDTRMQTLSETRANGDLWPNPQK
jgi:hypothetical protein